MAAKTFDEVYLVNYSSYDDVNLYEVGCQKCDPSYGYGPIIRKLYILHYVVSGEGILRINNHEFAIKEHDIFVIPAHTASYYEADENHPWNYIWIQFDGFKIKEMLNNCGLSDKSPILSLHQEAKKVEDCIRHILTNYGDEYACIGKVYELFQHMIHAANLKNKPQKKRTDSLTYIQTTIQFIRQKYSDPIRIQDIADYCGLNRSYLTRLFKHATGYTPQEYLAQYRINQAKQLLEENELSIQHIAYCVGYNNSFTFSKLFKRQTGFSPSDYRSFTNKKTPITEHTLHTVIGDKIE